MAELARLLAEVPRATKHRQLARLQWLRTRHDFQVPPPSYWYGWFLRAGRGAGKTRTGAEDVLEYTRDKPWARYAIVAPTYGDARDICIEGESGVRAQLEARGYVENVDYTWNRSLGEMALPNGAQVELFSSEKPDRLRGPQFHRAWVEEPASWKDASKGDVLDTTWNNLQMCMRLGDDPRLILTSTTRTNKLIQHIVERTDIIETRGSTYDNRAHLAAPFLRQVLRYEGTRIGKQELYAELLEDVEGAIWMLVDIDPYRIRKLPILDRVVVGVDPPGGITECGIVVAGAVAQFQVELYDDDGEKREETVSPCCNDTSGDEHYVVFRDHSRQGTPKTWATEVAEAYDIAKADRVVAEKNFGGDMVADTLTRYRPNLPVRMVSASRGKLIRAEPIQFLYEQGRVHHLDILPELEEEMTTWVPPTRPDASDWSPNRLDAQVWALTELSGVRRRDWGAA